MAGRPRDRHGSYGWYVNHKCRCPLCKMANRDYRRGLRERRRAEAASLVATPAPIDTKGHTVMNQEGICNV